MRGRGWWLVVREARRRLKSVYGCGGAVASPFFSPRSLDADRLKCVGRGVWRGRA